MEIKQALAVARSCARGFLPEGDLPTSVHTIADEVDRLQALLIELQQKNCELEAALAHTHKNLQIVGKEGDETEMLLIKQQERVEDLESAQTPRPMSEAPTDRPFMVLFKMRHDGISYVDSDGEEWGPGDGGDGKFGWGESVAGWIPDQSSDAEAD